MFAGGSEPMEALPPSTQPLAVMAGTEMVAASSFASASVRTLSHSRVMNRGASSKQMALPGPSSSNTSVELAKRRNHSVSPTTFIVLNKNIMFSVLLLA